MKNGKTLAFVLVFGIVGIVGITGIYAQSSNNVMTYSLPLQNPHNYLLYPAVGAAFTSSKVNLGAKTANLWTIDCLGNEFIIQDCVAERRMFDIISYQIKITYRDNQLIIEFINVKSAASLVIQYSDAELESLPRFDTQKTANQLKALIEQSLVNANAYGEAKKAFLANNPFLYRAFVPVTGILRDEFVSTLFMDGEISLNVRISDVNKNSNTEFSKYTTEVRATLYSGTATSRAFASITLYTNDNNLTRLKQGENTMLSGQLVRLEFPNVAVPSFIITK